MKVNLFILFVVYLWSSNEAGAQLESMLIEGEKAPAIHHSWIFGGAQFMAEDKDSQQIMDEATQWLREHGFRPVKSELVRKRQEGLWFTKLYEKRGRVIVRISPTGVADLVVESYEILPENATFRADVVLEYKPFALWMAKHKLNLQGGDPLELSKSIDDKVLSLRKKAQRIGQD